MATYGRSCTVRDTVPRTFTASAARFLVPPGALRGATPAEHLVMREAACGRRCRRPLAGGAHLSRGPGHHSGHRHCNRRVDSVRPISSMRAARKGSNAWFNTAGSCTSPSPGSARASSPAPWPAGQPHGVLWARSCVRVREWDGAGGAGARRLHARVAAVGHDHERRVGALRLERLVRTERVGSAAGG